MPPNLSLNQRILEGVITTRDGDGVDNIAPMGPIVDQAMTRFILRPFISSTTYRNLKATGEAVFHVTDDVLLLARGAIGRVRAGDEFGGAAVRPAQKVAAVVLRDACRYYELKATRLDDSEPRTRIEAEVVETGELRPFFGFNRAMHAVLEAAILATRLHMTGADSVLREYERLAVMVDKTGGEREHQAMNELWEYVRYFRAEPQAAEEANDG